MYCNLFKSIGQTPDTFYFDHFELRDLKLYYKGKDTSLRTREGKLRSVSEIVDTLGKNKLCNLGFAIPENGKVTARQAVMLNRVEEELPSTADIAKADDIELQEIRKNTVRSTEDLIAQLERLLHYQLQHPLCELSGLEKELRSIRGLLRVEMAKKVQLQQCIEKEMCKISEIKNNPEYNNGI